MKKAKKVKRYQDEGLVSMEDTPEGLERLKREGLAASSKDPREGGFMAGLKRLGQRFTEGNIDDPKSEAYRKYGAGRGMAERNANVPIEERSTPAPSSGSGASGFPLTPPSSGGGSRMPPGLAGVLPESAGGNMPNAERPPEESQSFPLSDRSKRLMEEKPAPRKKPKAKPKAKTKTGSGASGFSVDEKGIAQRRMEGLKKPKTSELEDEAAMRDKKRKALLATALGATGVALGAGALRKNIKKGSRASDNMPSSMGKNPRLMGLDPMMEGDLERMAGEGGPNFKKGGKVKPKPVKKYASGGMVGSASKRADGCAKKGKTKGRIL